MANDNNLVKEVTVADCDITQDLDLFVGFTVLNFSHCTNLSVTFTAGIKDSLVVMLVTEFWLGVFVFIFLDLACVTVV
jgi:hypothetical protein